MGQSPGKSSVWSFLCPVIRDGVTSQDPVKHCQRGELQSWHPKASSKSVLSGWPSFHVARPRLLPCWGAGWRV